MIDSKTITFINVARLKSYTRAAELLNLTQPAVSQHIRQLEDFYGVSLIRKKGRQIFLTEEGELFYKKAKEFEASSILLERALKNKQLVTKRYNIGATLTIGEFVLPGLLGGYKKLHPNIDVIMQVHNLAEVLKRVNSGELDLGIVEGPFDKRAFRYARMKDDELILVASPQSEMAAKAVASMEEVISGGKLILREKGSGTRLIFENKLLEMGCSLSDVKVYMEIGNIGAIKSLVAANLGYTVISKEAVKNEIEAGTLIHIPVENTRIMREFSFVYLDNCPEEFIKDFVAFLTPGS